MALSLSRLHDAARDHARGMFESDIRHKEYGSHVNLRCPCGGALRSLPRPSPSLMATRGTHASVWTPADPDSDLGSIYHEKKEMVNGYSESPQTAQPTITTKKTHPTLEDEIDEVVNMLEQTRDENPPTSLQLAANQAALLEKCRTGGTPYHPPHVESLHRCCEQYFREMTPIAFQRDSDGLAGTGFGNPSKVAARFVRTQSSPSSKDAAQRHSRNSRV